MQRTQPRKLLVEGQTDKRVIPYLMEANGIAWEDADGNPIVAIEPMGMWKSPRANDSVVLRLLPRYASNGGGSPSPCAQHTRAP